MHSLFTYSYPHCKITQIVLRRVSMGKKLQKVQNTLQQMKLKWWASWNIVGETSFLDIKLWTKLRDYLYIVSVYRTCDLHSFTTFRICFHMKDRVNLWLKLTGLPPLSPGYP